MNITRKECAQAAKKILKKHYKLFLIVCIFAAFLGSEYSSSARDIWRTIDSQENETGVASVMSYFETEPAFDTLQDLLKGQIKKGEDTAQDAVKEDQENVQSAVLGRTRGVFASLVNSVTSGGIFVRVYKILYKVSGSKDLGVFGLGLFAIVFYCFIYFYVKESFYVLLRRIFLEARVYDEVPISRFSFLFKVRKWSQVAWDMLVCTLYTLLWNLTVIGGCIKRYSYYMVPYILAENPSLKANEAITLSRNMMDGHKVECFKMELGFLGWDILSALTLGLSALFYSNLYRSAFFAEYYARVREASIQKNVEGIASLKDIYLFEKPDTQIIDQTYNDVISVLDQPKEKIELKGIQGFVEKWFGLILSSKSLHEKQMVESYDVESEIPVIEGKCYPTRLYFLQEKSLGWRKVYVERNYSLLSVVLMFFVFSVVGWLWEVNLHIVNDGTFVNRGVLHGPWLPIYGFGGVFILLILKHWRNKPAQEFMMAIVLSGFLEYFTSVYLQVFQGAKWWDYTGYFLNFQGRICAEGLLVFGLAGMAVVYVIAPSLDNWFRKFKTSVLIPVCVVLCTCFGVDTVYSLQHPNTGNGITNTES